MRIQVLLCLICWLSTTTAHFFFNPYQKFLRYGFPSLNNFIPKYSHPASAPSFNYIPQYTQQQQFYPNVNPMRQYSQYIYGANPYQGLNLLAESPYTIENTFSVVPMLVVSDDYLNMMQSGEIMELSKLKPTLTVKTDTNTLLQCTPAVKISLKTPILIYDTKSSILFPSAMSFVHGNRRIPIRVGAVLAPVNQGTYVSDGSPISINVVYAIPTQPISLDYVNHEKDVFVDQDNQAIVVDSARRPDGQTVPILNFPDSIAQPIFTGNGDDDELVNRNPPQPVVPAGIVQSSQPQTTLELFTNSKESAILTALREEAKKRI